MNRKTCHTLWIYIAIPAIMLLYYNQSANWHYHITEKGIVVEHAHPFTNNNIPDTPFQDHEHSDFQYLVLAQVVHAFGLVVIILFLFSALFYKKNQAVPLPAPVFFPYSTPGPDPTRGPPFLK